MAAPPPRPCRPARSTGSNTRCRTWCRRWRRTAKITTQVYDPNGFLGFLRFNHLHAPFNDVRVRRAIRDAMVQSDYMAAVALPGDWQECHAVFPCGLPGVKEFAPAPRGEAAMERARAALREAGYKGETVVLVNPSDFPAVTQQGRVSADLMRRLGVNIELVESDWATTIARRANKAPPAQGGWSLHNTNFPAAAIANPAVSPIIRGHGERAWFGWPTDAASEAEVEAWIGAADTATQAQARWPRCRRRPGRACPSRRPGCSACARRSGGT